MMQRRALIKYYAFNIFGVIGTWSILFEKFKRIKNKNESKNSKLIGVQLITRHGATTPYYLVPGITIVSFEAIYNKLILHQSLINLWFWCVIRQSIRMNS